MALCGACAPQGRLVASSLSPAQLSQAPPQIVIPCVQQSPSTPFVLCGFPLFCHFPSSRLSAAHSLSFAGCPRKHAQIRCVLVPALAEECRRQNNALGEQTAL